jgi:hypothetical protein
MADCTHSGSTCGADVPACQRGAAENRLGHIRGSDHSEKVIKRSTKRAEYDVAQR